VAEHKVILIDEVQNYPQSTIALKILHDEFKIKIIATGSSELRQKSGEAFDTLANRFTESYCLPLSLSEISDNTKMFAYEKDAFEKELLQKLQIFGAYPEIYIKSSKDSQKIELLQNLLDTYILKDIVKIYDLKSQKLAKDILTKIALQLSSEVSLREIANSLQANVSTVANYIEIFIKNYILIPLCSFKTSARRAVSENRKLYFYDLGIRNILVRDFRELSLRPDKGGVFENFIVSELEKRRKNLHLHKNMFFYREYGGKEVDLVLEDFYKNYTCVELKVVRKSRKDVFPLPHKFTTIDSQNYFTKITEVLA
jgi:predicted AAA+ superfamily ATPase